MHAKSYQDLNQEVWDRGKCSRCGACIAVCPADSLYFEQRANAPSPSHPSTSGYCKQENDGIVCGNCYRVCPRIKEAPDTSRSPLGEYIRLYSARATFPVERRQSGGAVTAILANALDEGLIDAVVTVTEDRWTLKSASAVITTSGALVLEAGSRYNWWVPLLAALKEAVIHKKCKHVAVVGLPCAVQAVQRIRESDFDLIQPFARSIRLVIGLFCTESFDYARLIEDKLGKEYAIKPWEIRRIDVKGRLDVTLINDESVTIPLDAMHDCVSEGCRICRDFTAVFSDISAGAVGSPPGYTTLILRNRIGEGFVERARERGVLETGKEVSTGIIERLVREKAERGPAP
jgi:coenzyme F420 hydrogenase subunit beta